MVITYSLSYDNYLKYVEENLIPNFPEYSVVVDDDRYLTPTKAPRKDTIKDWLAGHDTELVEKMLKVEIVFLVKQPKHRFVIYRNDATFEAADYSDLRLPSYQVDLNPIESFCYIVKQTGGQ